MKRLLNLSGYVGIGGLLAHGHIYYNQLIYWGIMACLVLVSLTEE